MEKVPPEVDVHSYDLSNSLQIGILECLLINNLNVNTLTRLGGIEDLARILQE